jgi:hypothetical protein
MIRRTRGQTGGHTLRADVSTVGERRVSVSLMTRDGARDTRQRDYSEAWQSLTRIAGHRRAAQRAA